MTARARPRAAKAAAPDHESAGQPLDWRRIAYLVLASRAMDDIEVAMTKGVNYPRGLLRWGNEIGLGRVVETLEHLQRDHGGARYRPSQLLRRMAHEGREFHQ